MYIYIYTYTYIGLTRPTRVRLGQLPRRANPRLTPSTSAWIRQTPQLPAGCTPPFGITDYTPLWHHRCGL